ncbi:15 kDa selenoprotein [Aphelenchoides fujianensis]|nr:15 kDa selenoprotein [Aphelenchoides fujianensis]
MLLVGSEKIGGRVPVLSARAQNSTNKRGQLKGRRSIENYDKSCLEYSSLTFTDGSSTLRRLSLNHPCNQTVYGLRRKKLPSGSCFGRVEWPFAHTAEEADKRVDLHLFREGTFEMTRLLLVLALLLPLAVGQKFAEDALSVEECKEAGFNRGTLKCSSCQLLPQFHLDEIYTDCTRCCSEESSVHEKYPYAVIEICECNLQRFPQVNAFVKGDLPSQWGSKLKIRHVRGVLPTIVLKNAEGVAQKTLNIERWDTDTIESFLNDWLE